MGPNRRETGRKRVAEPRRQAVCGRVEAGPEGDVRLQNDRRSRRPRRRGRTQQRSHLGHPSQSRVTDRRAASGGPTKWGAVVSTTAVVSEAGKLDLEGLPARDEERRSRIHPPPRGGRPHGRVDAGALQGPARGQAARKANGMPFTLPFSPDTIRWRRGAIVELRKLGIDL
jgi:hypothetical protein